MAKNLINLNKIQSKMVLSFYQAADDVSCWPEALKNLSAAIDDVAINIWKFDHKHNHVENKVDHGYEDTPISDLYDSELLNQCNLFRKMNILEGETVYYWNDVISYEGLLGSILWREWASMIPRKIPSPHTTARLEIDSVTSYQINTAYLTGFRNFEDSERRFWNQLILPHLWQALRLEQKISRSGTGRDTGFDVLDQLSAAVVLLSDQGAVLAANRSAERILAQQDGISLHKRRLTCASANEHREFSRLIAEAVQTGLGKVTGAGGFLSVSRPSLKRPYHVAIYPFLNGQKYSSESKPARVLVLIDDPEKRPEAPAHVLQRLYGISRAQSRVMILLLKGLKQEQIADELCLSKNTIKTHEREIFERLDVRSRSDLIRLVLPSLGSLQL